MRSSLRPSAAARWGAGPSRRGLALAADVVHLDVAAQDILETALVLGVGQRVVDIHVNGESLEELRCRVVDQEQVARGEQDAVQFLERRRREDRVPVVLVFDDVGDPRLRLAIVGGLDRVAAPEDVVVLEAEASAEEAAHHLRLLLQIGGDLLGAAQGHALHGFVGEGLLEREPPLVLDSQKVGDDLPERLDQDSRAGVAELGKLGYLIAVSLLNRLHRGGAGGRGHDVKHTPCLPTESRRMQGFDALCLQFGPCFD